MVRGGEKNKNKLMQGKMPREKSVQRRRERRKIHAEGKSNFDLYLINVQNLPVSIENNSH